MGKKIQRKMTKKKDKSSSEEDWRQSVANIPILGGQTLESFFPLFSGMNSNKQKGSKKLSGQKRKREILFINETVKIEILNNKKMDPDMEPENKKRKVYVSISSDSSSDDDAEVNNNNKGNNRDQNQNHDSDDDFDNGGAPVLS